MVVVGGGWVDGLALFFEFDWVDCSDQENRETGNWHWQAPATPDSRQHTNTSNTITHARTHFPSVYPSPSMHACRQADTYNTTDLESRLPSEQAELTVSISIKQEEPRAQVALEAHSIDIDLEIFTTRGRSNNLPRRTHTTTGNS
jgi:hypothetical protein